MKPLRILFLSTIVVITGCQKTPERPPFDTQVSTNFAIMANSTRCDVARAFAERDYVRDMLEPEATASWSMKTGDTGSNGRGVPNDELLLGASEAVFAIALSDRGPLPADCKASPGGRSELRDFLDRVRSELAKLRPGVRANSISYQHQVLLDDPDTARGREGTKIVVSSSWILTFRFKQAASVPAPAPEGTT